MSQRIIVEYESKLDLSGQLIDEICSKCLELGGNVLKVETEVTTREKIKAGMARAKERGEVLGAPRGNQNRAGKNKQYTDEEISELKVYLDLGLPYRKIREQISYQISIGKISYLKKLIEEKSV